MIQGIIIRGTTPQHDFELPYTLDLIKDLRITYAQNGTAIFTKQKDKCILTDGQVSVKLTQQETLSLKPKYKVFIEIKILLFNNDVVRTEDPIILRVIDTSDEEVMG